MSWKTIALLAAFAFLPLLARADVIYVLSLTGNTITRFNGDGDATLPVPFINTGLDAGISLTTDGTYLYAANSASSFAASVSKYTLDGTLVNASLISGLPSISQIVVDRDGNLLVPDNTGSTVAKYTADGVLLNSQFIRGVNSPSGITLDDTGHIYLLESLSGTISKYNSSGQLITNSLVTGFGWVSGLAYNDGYLYVSNVESGTIGKYGLDGTVVDADLITGLGTPMQISFDNAGHLYVPNREEFGTVGKYLVDGTPVDLNFITGVQYPSAVLYVVPEPVTPVLALSGMFLFVARRARLRAGSR